MRLQPCRGLAIDFAWRSPFPSCVVASPETSMLVLQCTLALVSDEVRRRAPSEVRKYIEEAGIVDAGNRLGGSARTGRDCGQSRTADSLPQPCQRSRTALEACESLLRRRRRRGKREC